ncbi:unnamed protein product [Citrullus colocynthis]|uniref:Uncharacterized protein n=1 Tax=Citrullus colocynthis TaxID=252529 RepID=A0ABP0XVZ3_9ROSI
MNLRSYSNPEYIRAPYSGFESELESCVVGHFSGASGGLQVELSSVVGKPEVESPEVRFEIPCRFEQESRRGGLQMEETRERARAVEDDNNSDLGFQNWRDERQKESENLACSHCDLLRAVPPLEQRVRTASASLGQAVATRHSARARFRCRQADRRAGPSGIRLWHSRRACSSRSQPPSPHIGASPVGNISFVAFWQWGPTPFGTEEKVSAKT